VRGSQLTVSERRACAVVGQSLLNATREPKVRADEAALTEAIVRLATRYGRHGYRWIRRLLVGGVVTALHHNSHS
jgi:hypothetical protein